MAHIEEQALTEGRKRGLGTFGGVKCRFTRAGEAHGSTAIDDCGHHPVVRDMVIAVVQPHEPAPGPEWKVVAFLALLAIALIVAFNAWVVPHLTWVQERDPRCIYGTVFCRPAIDGPSEAPEPPTDSKLN